jgi:hypothetical protein
LFVKDGVGHELAASAGMVDGARGVYGGLFIVA